jgi:hypothetical protein
MAAKGKYSRKALRMTGIRETGKMVDSYLIHEYESITPPLSECRIR